MRIKYFTYYGSSDAPLQITARFGIITNYIKKLRQVIQITILLQTTWC